MQSSSMFLMKEGSSSKMRAEKLARVLGNTLSVRTFKTGLSLETSIHESDCYKDLVVLAPFLCGISISTSNVILP